AADRGEAAVGLVLVNLDGLKAVNDTLGHSGGDHVVAVVAARLATLVRDGDTLARLEGDEFALLRPDPDDDLGALAGEVLAVVAEPVSYEGRTVTVTASSGTTLLRVGASGPDRREVSHRLFREADTALTEAKQRGGARNVAFEPGLRAASRHRRELAADLGAAIAAGQLRVVYQPLVDLATGRTRGFEALVRWTHPRHGVVPPSVFVPVAEDRGTVADIGRFVLATALAQLQVFDREHPAGCGEEELEISVNLSGRHLVAPGLVAEVADALARSGTAPHRLCLEVTESAVVSDLELASATLAQLRTLGVRIALDDFGTGYSSLSYLRRLPVDVLKIDKSFVDDVADVTAAALLQG
ncbi:MAG: GGDEF domain-containing protein, partial [Propionibacteriaceae bacterium]